MTQPNGPTYIIIEAKEGTYAQAAGTDGRYVVESRTQFGEGFQHFRVCRTWVGEDHPDIVYYGSKCSKHAHRRCPLHVQASEVCTLADVERSLVAFAETGCRDSELHWRDVTKVMLSDAVNRDNFTITPITPRRQ
jgi:hypothetical protein